MRDEVRGARDEAEEGDERRVAEAVEVIAKYCQRLPDGWDLRIAFLNDGSATVSLIDSWCQHYDEVRFDDTEACKVVTGVAFAIAEDAYIPE